MRAWRTYGRPARECGPFRPDPSGGGLRADEGFGFRFHHDLWHLAERYCRPTGSTMPPLQPGSVLEEAAINSPIPPVPMTSPRMPMVISVIRRRLPSWSQAMRTRSPAPLPYAVSKALRMAVLSRRLPLLAAKSEAMAVLLMVPVKSAARAK